MSDEQSAPEKFHDAVPDNAPDVPLEEDDNVQDPQKNNTPNKDSIDKDSQDKDTKIDDKKNEQKNNDDKTSEQNSNDQKTNEQKNKDLKSNDQKDKDHKNKVSQNKDPNDDDDISKSSGEELSSEETEQIITSMLNILQECQKKVDDQKIDSHSLVFMLLRIKESLDTYYGDYMPKINSYLVQSDKITTEQYSHISSVLPQYGDFVKAIEDEKSEKVDVGNGNAVNKKELLELVNKVTDNCYASGMLVKTDRTVIKDVNNCQPERKDIVYKMAAPLPKWMEFQKKVTTQLEHIREQTFKISAHIDFLKQGEMKLAPTLDLTALNQAATSSCNYNTSNTTGQ